MLSFLVYCSTPIYLGNHILSRTVGLFYKIRHYAPEDTLKLLYYGIFFPFLLYGIHVWGLTYPTYFETVFILQKRILKAITFSDIMTHALPIFRRLELLQLQDIHELQVASFVYDCINGFAPTYFKNFSLCSKPDIKLEHVKL